MLKRTILLFITTILLVQGSVFASNPSEIKKNLEPLKIGISPEYPPFEFIKDGKLQGFSVDLGEALAKELSRKAEFIEMNFSGLIAALQSRKIDLIISSLSITENRKKVVRFSMPYYVSKLSLVVLRGSEVKTMSDLKNKVAGVQLGSTMEQFIKPIAQTDNIKVISMDSNLVLVQELKKKIIDAIVIEESQAKAFAKANADLEYYNIPGDSYPALGYAIALRQGCCFGDEIDLALTKFKKNGMLAALEKKWLN